MLTALGIIGNNPKVHQQMNMDEEDAVEPYSGVSLSL